jgi:type II secretory pathway pseudopilin PulG
MKIVLRSPPGSGATGFTFVETMVAMAVAGVMIAALLGGLTWSTMLIRISRENLRASQILVEKMEVVRLLSWDQLTASNVIPGSFTAPYYATGLSNSVVSGPTFYGSISIAPPRQSPLQAAYTNDMRVISVQITWTNQGMAYSKQLSSYVSRYGIQNYLIN